MAEPMTKSTHAAVRIEGLCKIFTRGDGSEVRALDKIDLNVPQGEFVVLLGPSGCGKTTLLRSIAGLEDPDYGSIDLDGQEVFSATAGTHIPAERRKLGMMFQSYALWPHMTAFQNVAYPLQCQGLSKSELRPLVEESLRLVGIPELEGQYPGQMSGGQQQRVALARAIVGDRKIVLFDEPLSNVDAKMREELRFELRSMQRRLGFTAVYVTHDQEEALSLADKLAVLNAGRLIQFDTPREVFDRPGSRWVAKFVGVTNEIPGVAEGQGAEDVLMVDTSIGQMAATNASPGIEPSDRVVVTVRPHRCILHEHRPSSSMSWKGRIESSLFVGPRVEYMVSCAELNLRVWDDASKETLSPGSEVWLSTTPTDVSVFATTESDGVGGSTRRLESRTTREDGRLESAT